MKRTQSILLLLLSALIAISSAYGDSGETSTEPICKVLSAAAHTKCDPQNEPSNPSVHAMYFPKIDGYYSSAQRYVFSDEAPAKLIQYDDGTATLSGILVKNSKKFSLFAELSDPVGTPSSPKKELPSSCYVGNGGDIDPSSWEYYANMEGTLTALDGSYYEGAVIAIQNKGPAAQLGGGANGKNTEDGVAVWFTWEVVQQSSRNDFPPCGTKHADFNLDMSPCTATCFGAI